MRADRLKFDDVCTDLFSDVPELRSLVESAFGGDYDLEKESPGEYPIFEDVVKKFLFDALSSPQDERILRRLFNFFEKMAVSKTGE